MPAAIGGKGSLVGPGSGLLERAEVTATLRRLVDAVAAGESGAVFVLGEPGLGKTSLLDQAVQLATSAGLAVGLGRGHPMETGLPFGVLAEALDRAGGHGVLEPDESAGSMAGDRAVRFYAVLRWLQGQTGRGLLLVLDDLHWADTDSVALFSFVCRRLASLRLGLIAALRPWPSQAHEAVASLAHEGGGTIQRLGPLSEAASGLLLEDRVGAVVPEQQRHRAFALAAGNPLLLEQLAVALRAGGKLPDADAPGHAGFGRDVLLARFAGLPSAGMRCARAASVLGAAFVPEVAAEVAGLQGAEIEEALESLGRSGLISQQPGTEADFVHPLFRQSLYDDLAGPARARLHARAFAVLHARGMDAQAAEHAVQGRLVGDAEAVRVLEWAGRVARRAGAPSAALARLDAAADLAGERSSAELLLARAEALLATGQLDRAVRAYREVLGRPGLPATRRVEGQWMLGRALLMSGDLNRAIATLESAAESALPQDPRTAAEVLLDAAFSCWLTVGPGRAHPLAARARELAAPLGGALAIRGGADWGLIALQTGDPAGMAAAEPAAPWKASPDLDWSVDTVAASGGWGPINSFGYAAILVERLAEAERAFASVRALVADANAPVAIATVAGGHAYALQRMGRLDHALAAMRVAIALLEIVPLLEAPASAGLASILLQMGQLEESARWCERAAATAGSRGEQLAMVVVLDVQGHRALREGATAWACDHYTRLQMTAEQMGLREPCLPPWPRHAIAAYLAAGRLGDAGGIIEWLDDSASRMPCRYPRIAAATGRAWLAELNREHAEAEEHFQAALRLHTEVDLPIEHVETLLAYGSYLRRAGRKAAARPLLAEAAEVASAASAHWLAGFAKAELRVAGGRQRRRTAVAELTAQEHRVATLAAGGASNSEIARQLFLAVSTVESHLERIYTKLGIHSRYELIARAARDRWSSSG
jgi:DNA-binding CsgD family transcriptional regulator